MCEDCQIEQCARAANIDAAHMLTRRTHASFRDGERIYEEGARITGVYCLHSGAVSLWRRSDGGEFPVCTVSDGFLLGMPEAILAQHYQNSARAERATAACFLPHDNFLTFVERCPALLIRSIRQLSQRLDAIESGLGTPPPSPEPET